MGLCLHSKQHDNKPTHQIINAGLMLGEVGTMVVSVVPGCSVGIHIDDGGGLSITIAEIIPELISQSKHKVQSNSLEQCSPIPNPNSIGNSK